MKRSELKSLFEPQRQSYFAIVLILFKFIKLIIRQLWPLLIIFLINPRGSFDVILGILTLGIASISLLASVVSYFKFYYYIQDGKLHRGQKHPPVAEIDLQIK